MKILVDENMPYARELFSRLGDVQAVPGRPIPQEALTDADALMVRSVTKVNEALLSGKAIKFVGTATAGTDHVDQAWLQQAGIGFSAAPGCNAIAVVEYVFSALLMLADATDSRWLIVPSVSSASATLAGVCKNVWKRWELKHYSAIRRAPIVAMKATSAAWTSWCNRRMS